VPDTVATVETANAVDADVLIEEAPARGDEQPAGRNWVGVLLLLALVYGALGRLSSAEHLSPHIDEPASVLAARMVAERGVPIFPSGVPYFQGATLSYLLAPFSWIGLGDLDDLHTLRLISVLIGVLTIGATFLLARQVSGRGWVGALAAMLVASDPISVKWSGLVRMYALLELFAVLFVWMMAVILMDGPTRRRLALATLFFWLGIFTHIATALLWPAAALVALAVYGRKLWHERRDLGLMLAVSAAAPVALTVLNSVLSRLGAPASAGGQIPGVSFVGDHLLTFDTLSKPSFRAWEELFMTSTLLGVMPYVMVLASAVLIGFSYLSSGEGMPPRRDRIGTGLLLGSYWLPVILVGVFTQEPQERYVIHIVPSGFVLIALAVQRIGERAAQVPSGRSIDWQRRVFAGSAIALVALMVVNQTSAALGLWRTTTLDPDYVAVSQYVEARREPGDVVMSAMTPAPYLAFGESDDGLIFLSGNAYSTRTQRYTRVDDNGQVVDYWIGAPSVYMMNDLCNAILSNPGAWIIIDEMRLNTGNFFGGDTARVIRGLTYQAYWHPSGAMVLRPAPAPGRQADAERICANAARLAEQGITEATWDTPPLRFR
jgi:hypothetical protein